MPAGHPTPAMNPVDGDAELTVTGTFFAVCPARHAWGKWQHNTMTLGLSADAAGLRHQLATGRFKIIRRGVPDGHKAIELGLTGLSPQGPGLHATAARLWVDAASYLPLRQVPRFSTGRGRRVGLPVPPADGREPGEAAPGHPDGLSPDLAAVVPTPSHVNRWPWVTWPAVGARAGTWVRVLSPVWVWTVRPFRAMFCSAVDEPAEVVACRLAFLNPARDSPDRLARGLGWYLPGGLVVIPRTMLPGGRGPRRVAPVRCAGRSTCSPWPSLLAGCSKIWPRIAWPAWVRPAATVAVSPVSRRGNLESSARYAAHLAYRLLSQPVWDGSSGVRSPRMMTGCLGGMLQWSWTPCRLDRRLCVRPSGTRCR